MDNTFGVIYRTTTFGESHSKGVGAVIDGCPPNIEISESLIQKQLDRRKPGLNKFTTQRGESDTAIILSGVENGKTLGTPIAVVVTNGEFRPDDYKEFANVPRPSHADFTYREKFAISASSGGGRASARETVGRVISGAIAQRVLKNFGIEIVAFVSRIGEICVKDIDENAITQEIIDASASKCPNALISDLMEKEIEKVKAQKNSIGAVVSCVCRGVPTGLGNPVFDKIDALLAQAMLSIPAAKGFEIGSGFSSSKMKGSEHNDAFVMKNGVLRTKTNNSGGVQGGITNGENIVFNVAFKPTATIGLAQDTVGYDTNSVTLEGKGRHDPCVAVRAVPVVEAMAAMVLLDCLMRQKAIK
ncbi:MAG: chorismate synthase [Chitinispirillales bacterium]|jgi:chorismate synthase|nr:chorismate synthase [Chitinispirillales bacterium]